MHVDARALIYDIIDSSLRWFENSKILDACMHYETGQIISLSMACEENEQGESGGVALKRKTLGGAKLRLKLTLPCLKCQGKTHIFLKCRELNFPIIFLVSSLFHQC